MREADTPLLPGTLSCPLAVHPLECLLKELWSHGGGKKGGWLCGRWGLGAEYTNPVWSRPFGLLVNSKCWKMIQWRYIFALCVYMSETLQSFLHFEMFGAFKLYQQLWSELGFMCQSNFPNPHIGFRFGENLWRLACVTRCCFMVVFLYSSSSFCWRKLWTS